VARRLANLVAGLKLWPNWRTWAYTGLVFAAYAALAWGIGFGTGLYRFEPQLDGDLLRIAVIALFVPAIGEEVFFRGLLVPTRTEKAQALPQIGLGLTAFLAWHPINAWLFFPGVLPLFSDWRFLVVTALLGVACVHLWRKIGSLWPPVALHWLAVVIWKGFLGAPRML
jgi:uncharacterized protein